MYRGKGITGLVSQLGRQGQFWGGSGPSRAHILFDRWVRENLNLRVREHLNGSFCFFFFFCLGVNGWYGFLDVNGLEFLIFGFFGFHVIILNFLEICNLGE